MTGEPREVYMRFGVFAMMIFWVLTPYRIVDGNQHFGGNCCLHLQDGNEFEYSEDGGSNLLLSLKLHDIRTQEDQNLNTRNLIYLPMS
jgi:hypothetical protein